MGLIGRLRSFFRTALSGDNVSQSTVDLGAGHVVYADHFSAPGDDSHPLDDDYCIALSNGREEGFAVVGYVDQRNAGVAAKGEKRIYGRDSAGASVCQVHCKADGAIVVSNATGVFTVAADGSISGVNPNGNFTLQAGGDFVVNGATIATDGSITSPVSVAAPSVQANGKELAEHTHVAGTPPGNTGVNN